MTPEFREAVKSFKQGPKFSNESGDLLMQIQNLFEKLEVVDGTTEGITRSLCIRSVYEQQDAVEYFQKILKTVEPQVRKGFEGKLSNRSKCSNDHVYQDRSPFITVPLAVEAGHNELYNVKEGLEAFFKLSRLDEDNWLYCDQCDQKTETETWIEMEEFPTILTLHLKRFDFDYVQMRHVKNGCPMDIPLSIHLKDCEYGLYAVINHSGGYSGGHYNAIIKSFEDNMWYCFDDSSVTKDSVSSLKHSRLAYLLMYRRTVSVQVGSSPLRWKHLGMMAAGVLCLIPVLWRALSRVQFAQRIRIVKSFLNVSLMENPFICGG
ncbi:ubiquitin carboxyl-terminal hydrolase 47 isoform X2 [Brachyhypopomus gauderio]